MPHHSDIDLLVLTDTPVAPQEQEKLVNETYPLFLECGTQVAPQFRTTAQFGDPEDERTRAFFDGVGAEGAVLCRHIAER
jgi:hypothetical protein